MTGPVNNRRTLCDHCSFRTDLPGWIGPAHAQENYDRVKAGEIFPCHMVNRPDQPKTELACAGAVLISGAAHQNPIGEDHPAVYDSLEAYLEAQKDSRATVDEFYSADRWKDAQGHMWYGFWRRATSGKWHYLITTVENHNEGSAYLFFDQCQDLFGPLQKVDKE